MPLDMRRPMPGSGSPQQSHAGAGCCPNPTNTLNLGSWPRGAGFFVCKLKKVSNVIKEAAGGGSDAEDGGAEALPDGAGADLDLDASRAGAAVGNGAPAWAGKAASRGKAQARVAAAAGAPPSPRVL